MAAADEPLDRSARPDQDGRFRFNNLPPGGYYAIAVDYVAQANGTIRSGWSGPARTRPVSR